MACRNDDNDTHKRDQNKSVWYGNKSKLQYSLIKEGSGLKLEIRNQFQKRFIKELILVNVGLTAEDVPLLISGLENADCLEKLNLGRNKIKDAGVNHLVEYLKGSSAQLTKLHLQTNQITVKGAKSLVEMLQVNCAILHLGLDDNQIGDEGARIIAKVLSHTEQSTSHHSETKMPIHLSALYLGANGITDDGGLAMADMLNNNNRLKNLSLNENLLTDKTVGKIVQSLITTNRTLTNLDLFKNIGITDASVQLFIDLFKTQRKFKLFKLYRCGFTTDGIWKIKEAASKINAFRLEMMLNEDPGLNHRPEHKTYPSNSTNGLHLRRNNKIERNMEQTQSHRDMEKWCTQRKQLCSTSSTEKPDDADIQTMTSAMAPAQTSIDDKIKMGKGNESSLNADDLAKLSINENEKDAKNDSDQL